MSVYLGSVTAFGSSIDWNQDIIWMSVNIGGTGTPTYDGEMSPFTRFSSTPYALNSKALSGLTSGNFVQLAQGLQTDASSVNPSIFVNKTGGTANILQLQKSGVDAFVLSNAGNAIFSGNVTMNSNVIGTFNGTENLAVTSDLAGSVNISSITATPSATTGTTSGYYIVQADSANSNGLDAAFSVDNADTNLAIPAVLKVTNSGGGGYTTIIDNQGTLISGAELNQIGRAHV